MGGFFRSIFWVNQNGLYIKRKAFFLFNYLYSLRQIKHEYDDDKCNYCYNKIVSLHLQFIKYRSTTLRGIPEIIIISSSSGGNVDSLGYVRERGRWLKFYIFVCIQA